MKAKHLIIPLDIYKRGVLVFIGSNEELMAYIGKKDAGNLLGVTQFLDDDPTTLAQTIKTPTDAIIHARKMPSSILTFVHEADHAAFGIMQIVGIDPHDEEAHAYMQEYILKKIFEWLDFSSDIPESNQNTE